MASNHKARRLVQQLDDKDPQKRQQALQGLRELGVIAAPELIEALHSRRPTLPSLAAALLVEIGPSATPALSDGLLDEDPEIRARCAHILAQTRDPLAVPALLRTIQDKYFTVRGKATMALGEIHAPETLQALVEMLSDPEPEVRASALQAVCRYCNPATFDQIADLLLEDPSIEVRQAAAKALGETRLPEALPYLAVALRDSFWWFEREGAIVPLLDAFLCIGEPSVDPLIEALHDTEGTVRSIAAGLLGRLGDRRAIEPLEMALYDMHSEVGQTAAVSLAGFGDDGLKILADASHHPEAWLRQHAVRGLTLSKDKRIVTVLLQLLEDPERNVVRLVIQSLGELGDNRAIPALQTYAADRSDREFSSLARQAIEEIGKKSGGA
jgi:HEAT repeat protein